MAHPRFEEAGKAYSKAGKVTAERQSMKTCGQELGDGQVCLERGLYTETWRGVNYHLVGTCAAKHKTERYGYSERPVNA